MGEYEIIDRLCSVNEELLKMVRKQAELIAQYNISVEVQAELESVQGNINTELDVIEYRLRDLRR